MTKIIFLCLFISVMVLCKCTAHHEQGEEVPKHSPPNPKPMEQAHVRFRRESETTTAAAASGGKSKDEEEKDDKNSNEASRMKREEDDDTPMHDGEELDEEGDKSDVGLEAKNDTETTMESSAESEGSTTEHAEDDEETNALQPNETARKKRDDNHTDDAEDCVRSRNRRASATNSKAKMAVKGTKTATGGGPRGPRGAETRDERTAPEGGTSQ